MVLIMGKGEPYPRRVYSCGKEVFAIGSKLQPVACGWELQILNELDASPVYSTAQLVSRLTRSRLLELMSDAVKTLPVVFILSQTPFCLSFEPLRRVFAASNIVYLWYTTYFASGTHSFTLHRAVLSRQSITLTPPGDISFIAILLDDTFAPEAAQSSALSTQEHIPSKLSVRITSRCSSFSQPPLYLVSPHFLLFLSSGVRK